MFVMLDRHPGEKIDSAVKRVASDHNVRVVRNLLLDLGTSTADFSYVLIDSYGLMVVDVEMWPGATIYGASRSKRWVARCKGTRRQRFQNPLKANVRRVEALKEALLAFGKRLPPEYFANVVVLYDADISRLSLSESERVRTINGFDLEETLRARYDFAVNPGTVEREEIEEIASLLQSLDRSEDRKVLARHERQQASPRRLALFSRQSEIVVDAHEAGLEPTPIAPRLTQDRYPGFPAPAKKRGAAGAVFVLTVLAAVVMWMFLYGGYSIVTATVGEVIGGSEPAVSIPAAPIPVSASGGQDISRAKDLLQQNAPDTFAAVIDLDTPEVAVVEEYTTYTWHYVDSSSGEERWIALTVDSSGVLRGVTQP